MYVPAHFREDDPAELAGLIAAYPLATLVSAQQGVLTANLVPMLLVGDVHTGLKLHCHFARNNPQWQTHDEVLVIFNGPNAYVSPGWYASKRETGKGVPTWNYAMVQARGRIRTIDDPDWLRMHLAQLSARFEAGMPVPWQLDEAPAEYIDGMLPAIIGVEIVLSALSGKFKMSQNRSAADRAGVMAGLREQGGDLPAAQRVAQMMETQD